MSDARPNPRELFATNMKRLRLERGWSQETLAMRAGVHRNYMSDIEHAERKLGIDVMDRIAAALEVDLAQMFMPAEAGSGDGTP